MNSVQYFWYLNPLIWMRTLPRRLPTVTLAAILQLPLKTLSQHYIYTQTRLKFMRHMSIICTSTHHHYLFKRSKTLNAIKVAWHSIFWLTSRCIITPFRLNRRSCLLSESENSTYRNYVLTTCISNWLIWKQKLCKTFLSNSRNISIIIVTQNSLKRVSWPIFWTKYVTL